MVSQALAFLMAVMTQYLRVLQFSHLLAKNNWSQRQNLRKYSKNICNIKETK